MTIGWTRGHVQIVNRTPLGFVWPMSEAIPIRMRAVVEGELIVLKVDRDVELFVNDYGNDARIRFTVGGMHVADQGIDGRGVDLGKHGVGPGEGMTIHPPLSIRLTR